MITTLTGSNVYMRRAALHKIIEKFADEHGDFGIEKIDGEETDFDTIRAAIQSLPFLSAKKLVIINSPGSNKTFVDQAETLLSDVSSSNEIILHEPHLDKRTSYFKFLKASTQYQEYNDLSNPELVNWISNYVKDNHGIMAPAEAQYLIERSGTDQLRIKNDLDKLLLYDIHITRKTISLLVEPTPQSTIFELLDAAFNGQPTKTLQLYSQQRSLKVEPPQIIAMLTWQLHILAIIKTAGNRSPAEIAKEAHLNPFVVSKSQRIAQHITLSQLKQLINKLLDLDRSLKSTAIDADEALQTFLLELSISD